MMIVISDNDHVNLAQEEAVFQKAGMDFTLYQCHTEEEAIQQLKGAEIILNQYTPPDPPGHPGSAPRTENDCPLWCGGR